MHEYHIVENLVKQVLAEAERKKASRVTKVNLSVGDMLGFDAEAIRMYFQTIAEPTIARDAEVTVHWSIAGRDIYIENIEIETED